MFYRRLLIGLPKLLPHKNGSFRWFSSSGPFWKFGNTINDNDSIGDDIFFDAAKEKLLTVPKNPHPQQLMDLTLIGASQGWGIYSDLCNHSLFISDYLNPLASKSKPTKVIPLPLIPDLHNKFVCNIALSSSPCDHEDWVVAVKFLGSQVSLCRPNCDKSWTNMLTLFTFWEHSNLLYSKRDQRFYLPAPGTGSNYLCSWDIQFKNEDSRKVHKFLYRNRPKFSQSEHNLLDSCAIEEHWLESPSGERFLVKCYSSVSPFLKTEMMFLVFREEETTEKGTIVSYTEDIGDLCIFISESDPFCVEASLCSGLIPNSIYLTEPIFGIYDLATKNIRHFENKVERPPKPEDMELASFPYWLPPSSN